MITLRQEQRGMINGLLLPLIIVVLLLLAAAAFGVWAYSGKQDYKNNVDAKITDAVSTAIQKEDTKQAAVYAEQAKSPLKTYNGPAAYGSLQVHYPKTWSAYVVEQTAGSSNVDGYFNPNFVPSVDADTSSFALRIRVLNQSYSSVVQNFQSDIIAQNLTATPYALPKVPSIVGLKLSGAILPQKQGTMVVLPLRANTLEIWTDGTSAAGDFNTYILPNLSFSP